MQNSALITIENLNKIYSLGSTTLNALDHINLTVMRGEFLGARRPQRLG